MFYSTGKRRNRTDRDRPQDIYDAKIHYKPQRNYFTLLAKPKPYVRPKKDYITGGIDRHYTPLYQ